MIRHVVTVAAAGTLWMSLTACRTAHDRTEWRLPLTESFTIQSSVVGSDFEIMVALPRGYAESTATYPVLYVLDANGMFPIAVETARFLTFDQLKVDPVIVGIGYPTVPFWNTLGQRIRDFTPTQDSAAVHELSARFQFAPAGSGGAAAFLRFIADEVVPAVETRYRIDKNRRVLHGYSLGGLFAAYALFQQPSLFQSFLIGAPGLWWDNDAFWKLANAFASSGRNLPARVFLTVGSLDRRNLESFERLQGMFQSRRFGELVWHAEVFDNETHNSAISLSLSRGIRRLYGDLSPTPR